ncbi:Ryanodine receptor 3 [Taenia solium]|eukprot:TsM_000359700 transcript=TsM_000359700 gene=TsM_000359700
MGRNAESESPYSEETQLESDRGAVYYFHPSGLFDESLTRMSVNVTNPRLFQLVSTATVIAFNFFRKFYTKEEDGEKENRCDDMSTCFVSHLHTSLRVGGGIGDEIEPPDGDAHEALRILLDISLFFPVIITFLEIIRGRPTTGMCGVSVSPEDGSAGRRNVFAYIHPPILAIVLLLGFSSGPADEAKVLCFYKCNKTWMRLSRTFVDAWND